MSVPQAVERRDVTDVDDVVEVPQRSAGMAVELRDVTRRYPQQNRSDATALDGVTLSIAAGQAAAILGPPGSGKSTLLGLIAGQDRPDAGSVSLDGLRLDALPDRRLARLRVRIGIVSPESHQAATGISTVTSAGTALAGWTSKEALTVAEAIVLPLLGERRTADRYERVRELLDAVGLAQHADIRVPDLSAGDRRRLALAHALAGRPSLLLADEPSADLDRATAAAILDLITRLTRRYGMTLLLATRDDAVAARFRRVIRLRDGAVVEDETAVPDHDATRRWIERSAPSR